jgi:hypothetical protein
MLTTNLNKVGGSAMLAVASAVLDMQPARRYTLAELLAQCHPETRRAQGRPSKAEREWLEGRPVGGELI